MSERSLFIYYLLLNDIQFTIIKDQEKREIFTFEKLKRYHFCSKSNLHIHFLN